jgi:hypothetical protein
VLIKAALDTIHFVRHLAEPDDVRPKLARDAARGAGWVIAERFLPMHPIIAGKAPSRLELAMHVEHALRPCPLVKIVDILSDDQKLARPFRVQPRQRFVSFVGLHLFQPRAAGIIECLHENRIAPECLRSRDILDPM